MSEDEVAFCPLVDVHPIRPSCPVVALHLELPPASATAGGMPDADGRAGVQREERSIAGGGTGSLEDS